MGERLSVLGMPWLRNDQCSTPLMLSPLTQTMGNSLSGLWCVCVCAFFFVLLWAE